MRKMISTVVTGMMCVFLLAGCATNSSEQGKDYAYPDSYQGIIADANDSYAPVIDEAGEEYAGGYSEDLTNQEINPEVPELPGTASQDTFVISTDRKLVYTCNLSLETLTFSETLSQIRAQVFEYGGYISQETQSDTDYGWYYKEHIKNQATQKDYLVIRIPTEHYDAFLSTISEQGKVTGKSQQVADITKGYVNTQTTISALQKEEKRLLEMMDSCTTIEEMIIVEDRLTEVQNELAQYESNLATMDENVAYSTITITLSEVLEYTPDEPVIATKTFGDRLLNAFSGSLENVAHVLESILIAFIYCLPFLLILALVVFAGIFFVRFIIKRSRKKKEAKQAIKQ